MRKPLYFGNLVRIDDVTPSWKSAAVEKRVMIHAGDIWCFSIIYGCQCKMHS